MVETINSLDVWSIVRWFYWLALAVYFVFSLIAWRQIDLMARTLNGSLNLPIRLLGVILVGIAGVALLIGVMIL